MIKEYNSIYDAIFTLAHNQFSTFNALKKEEYGIAKRNVSVTSLKRVYKDEGTTNWLIGENEELRLLLGTWVNVLTRMLLPLSKRYLWLIAFEVEETISRNYPFSK